jgi:hypothetical protein
MPAVTRAALLMLCLSLSAGAQIRRLALYNGQTNHLDVSATQAAKQELQRLLAPIGVELIWKDLAQRKSGEEFDQVVVSSFDGSCSELDVPTASTNLLEASVSLADSSVSNGRVLPFFRVDCQYLVRMLAPVFRSMNIEERHETMGRALARVMAHEIYHIVGQTTKHQDRGVAKAAFSVRDLTADRFDLDAWSLAQMRPIPMPGFLDAKLAR